MPKALRPSLLALFLLFPSPAAKGARPAFLVERAVDGDTLKLKNGDRVRLIGVDTPESHVSKKLYADARRKKKDIETIRALGKKASAFTRDLVQGQTVELDFEPSNARTGHKDHYGRLLAYVYFTPRDCGELEDWVALDACELESYEEGFLNALLIEAGYAYAYTRFPFKHLDEFRQYEREAREKERGLWRGEPGF